MNLASTYIIVRDGEKFVLKKIVGTSFVDVNQEEINFIMKSLINQSLNIDTIINTIISMIDTNSISSSEELENYINGLSLSVEDKMNLYNKCIVYINSNNNKL